MTYQILPPVQQRFEATSDAQMTRISGVEIGDVCHRTDMGADVLMECFAQPSATLANWRLWGSGAGGGGVISVFGRGGAVTAAANDYTSSQITNSSAVSGQFVTNALNTLAGLDAAKIPLSQKGLALGVASLDSSGKVPAAQLPDLGAVATKVTVANQAARLALPVSSDLLIAYQTDNGNVYALNANTDPSQLANWTQVGAVTANGVTQWNTRTGAVVPASGDYTAAQVTNVPAGRLAGVTVQAALAELDALAPARGAAAPQPVGTTNVTGVATAVSREDHVHAHGDQAGGTLHALATGSTPGFMSAAQFNALAAVVQLSSTAGANLTGAAGIVGVGTTAARADHTHALAFSGLTSAGAAVDTDEVATQLAAGARRVTLLALLTNRTITTPTIVGAIELNAARVNSGASANVPAIGTATISRYTLNANTTLTLPARPTASNTTVTLTVDVVQDGTGGRTVAWAAQGGDSIKWSGGSAPAAATVAGAVTSYAFMGHAGETAWRGVQTFKE